MDEKQKWAINHYNHLIASTQDLAQAVGRSEKELGLAKFIWEDIVEKIHLEKNKSVLDIGCGYGEVTQYVLNACRDFSLDAVLFDIESVIEAIKKNFSDLLTPRVRLESGVFPYEVASIENFRGKFDFVIVYSVLHYTDEPLNFVRECVKFLADKGRLFIGDLPNVNKKGRFLTSKFGREFEARWQGKPLAEIPEYRSHQDFVNSNQLQTAQINDDLVLGIMAEFREAGYNVFVLPQRNTLPYFYTREDILIEKL